MPEATDRRQALTIGNFGSQDVAGGSEVDTAAVSDPVHEPDGASAETILPENVCLAVTVEIAFHGSRC